MAICSKCGKNINNDSAFCPFCGDNVSQNMDVNESLNANESDKEVLPTNKQISKRAVIGVIGAIVVMVFLTIIVTCEIKISNAKSLYAQGEYYEAYRQIRNIPSLGREELIRIKTAADAAWYYEDYLSTKRIRLSSTSSKSKDAYQSAFWELTSGLDYVLRTIDSESENLSKIERDEYQKFINIYYSELSSMFSMSKTEADELVDIFQQLDTSDKMKDVAYKWLDNNFF